MKQYKLTEQYSGIITVELTSGYIYKYSLTVLYFARLHYVINELKCTVTLLSSFAFNAIDGVG